MVSVLEQYGFKPAHQTTISMSHRRAESSIDQAARKSEAKAEFRKYDVDDVQELDFFQLRKYFESHGLVLSDEQIKAILKKNLITRERVNVLDFQQLYEDSKLNYFNNPTEGVCRLSQDALTCRAMRTDDGLTYLSDS